MDAALRSMPLAVAPRDGEALMGPLQILFCGLAAGVAIGATIMKQWIDVRPSKRVEDSLELGMVPARAGVPLMMADVHEGPGKGFGGGEATRDPAPTEVDPNDPKGKQQAIHKAESFAEYLAKRKAEGGGAVGKGFGGGEATRDPAPTEVDPND